VSKKSLDDYLSQLRQGRQYGFDFNCNKNEKVGILRQYVKKELEKQGIKVDDVVDDERPSMKKAGSKKKTK